MKTFLKFIIFFLVLWSFYSCVSDIGSLQKKDVWCALDLIFRDAQGNDLVKGILNEWDGVSDEENPSGFKVNSNEFIAEYLYDSNYKGSGGFLYVKKENDFYRLSFPVSFTVYPIEKAKEHNVTIRLQCPHIFKDNVWNPHGAEVHVIDSWWKPKENDRFEYVCYRIELDGKRFPDISYAHSSYIYVSKATIVLDDQ